MFAIYRISLTFFTLLLHCSVFAAPVEDKAELLLINIMDQMQQNNWAAAASNIESLEKQFPNFRLNTLLKEAAASQIAPQGLPPGLLEPKDDEYLRENLLAELKLRTEYRQHHPDQDKIPADILKLADNIQYAFIVDTQLSRLYLFENSQSMPVLLADYYIGIGKQGIGKELEGDHRTPIGVYTIVDDIPDKELNELYGAGALPIDYPNTWDRRLQRTGYGIWLHGVPRNTYSRPPRSSRGCVTVSNEIYKYLRQYATAYQTPFLITQNIQWVTKDVWQTQRNRLETALQRWQQNWESLDFTSYIANYSTEFKTPTLDYKGWMQKKQAINSRKTHIDVELSNISLFIYPGEKNLIQVHYRQHYKSNNFNASANKKQYWRDSEDGSLNIIYEGLR